MQEKRTVTLCEATSLAQKDGRGPKLWAFGYSTLAKLLGLSENAIRQAVHQGRLDPSDLEMVCESWMHYHPHRARQFVLDLDWREKEDRTAQTPEEKEVLKALREAREKSRYKPDPVEEAERMVKRCKEAPFLRPGPLPQDLERGAQLDMSDPEIRGMVLAKCAAGEHDEYVITYREVVGKGRLPDPPNEAESLTDEYAERLLIAGGFPPESARLMVKAKRD